MIEKEINKKMKSCERREKKEEIRDKMRESIITKVREKI